MNYFYDYFAKEYRKKYRGSLWVSPAGVIGKVSSEDVQRCRRVLKNAFASYREGRNVELMKKLLGKYREYVSHCHDEHAKDRYNAFVYRYMVEVHVGVRAIGAKLGVTKETIYIYINGVLDEILMLCMGIPAAVTYLEGKENVVRMLTEGSSLFKNMAGEYVISLFPGTQERKTVKQSRQLTMDVMKQFTQVVRIYYAYCNDEHTRIDTDIRKAKILEKCLAGVTPAAIAEEYGCCESTVYSDIRENERRLAAMLFERS